MNKYTLLKNTQTGLRSVRNNATGEIVREMESPVLYKEIRRKTILNKNRAERYQCMKDLGLSAHKNMSGTVCWE